MSKAREGVDSPGGALEPTARAFFESRFGCGLPDVRVHSDARAAASARALHARAFAFGRDIVFARGVYQPHTLAGRRVLAHELSHVLQQERSAPVVQRLDDESIAPEFLSLEMDPFPTRTSASAPDTAPFPDDWRAENFLTPDGRELWSALEQAWTWAVTDPDYAVRVVHWIESAMISRLRSDAEQGAGASDLPGAIDALGLALAETARAIEGIAGVSDEPRVFLQGPFSLAADRVDVVDERLPESMLETIEAMAGADPLLAVYLRHFPSGERPPDVDFNMRTRLALALSEQTFPEAVVEAAMEAIRDPHFVPMVVLPMAAYVALWMAPDVTLTKVAAATLTALLLTMFAWNDIITFAYEWAVFTEACASATTEEELREAGSRLTGKAGQVGFDLLLVCMFWGLGKSAGAKLSGRAGAIEAARKAPPREATSTALETRQLPEVARQVPEAPRQLPVPSGPPLRGPYRWVAVEGGRVFVDAEGTIHMRVNDAGRIEFMSESLFQALVAYVRSGSSPGRSAAAPGELASTSQPRLLVDSGTSAVTAEPVGAVESGARTGGVAGPSPARPSSANAPVEAPGSGRQVATRTMTENDLIVEDMLTRIHEPQLPVLFVEPPVVAPATPLVAPAAAPAMPEISLATSAAVEADLRRTITVVADNQLVTVEVVRRRSSPARTPVASSATFAEVDTAGVESATGSTSEEIAELMSEETSMLTPEAERAQFEAEADDVRGRMNPTVSVSTSGPQRAQAAAEAGERARGRAAQSPTAEVDAGPESMPEFPRPGLFGAPADPVEGPRRVAYMGGTPDKFSPTGQAVLARMQADGLIRGNGPLLPGNPNRLQVEYEGNWYLIDETIDMAHLSPNDAVIWWNEVGRFTGARSAEVREFMLDPDNYTLMPGGPNRAAGASLDEQYLPPEVGVSEDDDGEW